MVTLVIVATTFGFYDTVLYNIFVFSAYFL